MTGIRIESDGTPTGTRVYYGDNEITGVVAEVEWRHDAWSRPEATVTVRVVEAAEMSGGVHWTGLGHVPTDALIAELDTRSNDGKWEV